jgi:rhodanese-related sulfurtransferase
MTTAQRISLSGILITLLIWGCGSHNESPQVEKNGFELMIDFIENHTDFINSDKAPGVINIDALIKGTKNGLLIIDMRPASAYDTGHFPGAVNVRMNQLLNYLENDISPVAFDTIALISEDSQDAFYAVGLLRLLGYNNLFAVRYGMGWHVDYASSTWLAALSSEGERSLVTGESPPDNTHSWPEIHTETDDGYSVLRNRVSQLLNEGFVKIGIQAQEVLTAPQDYFIINYFPEHEYVIGHIKGARQYNPKKSLKRSSRLKTLPPDHPIVVYCHQGNNSATVAAYLRVLGYEAYSLVYGTNSFMYDKQVQEHKRGFYNPQALLDFPLEGSGDDRGQRTGIPVLKEIQSEGGC